MKLLFNSTSWFSFYDCILYLSISIKSIFFFISTEYNVISGKNIYLLNPMSELLCKCQSRILTFGFETRTHFPGSFGVSINFRWYVRDCEYCVMEKCVIFLRRVLMFALFSLLCNVWKLKPQFSSLLNWVVLTVLHAYVVKGVSHKFEHMLCKEFATFPSSLYFLNSVTNFQRQWLLLTLSLVSQSRNMRVSCQYYIWLLQYWLWPN